jgi:predicted KAP-like P-loop ATPase
MQSLPSFVVILYNCGAEAPADNTNQRKRGNYYANYLLAKIK